MTGNEIFRFRAIGRCTVALMAATVLADASGAAGLTNRIRVACIGDSITWGYAMTNRTEECYPVRLQQLLGDGYEVRNFGDPGSGVYLAPAPDATGWRSHPWQSGEQARAAYAFAPDIIVSNLGINDVSTFLGETRGDAAAEARAREDLFVRQYVELLEGFRANGRRPRYFVWTRLAPLGKQHRLKGRPVSLMEAPLRRVADAIGAERLDMFAPLLPFAETPHFAEDGVHPEGLAQRRIAEMTARRILRHRSCERRETAER